MVLLLVFFLFFLAFNYLEATLPSLVSRIAPAGNRGTAMGVYSSSQFFGAFMGGALGGNLYGMYEITGVYGMCLAIALLWLVVGMGMLPPPNTKSMILPLKPFAAADCNRIAGELQAVNGVEDVTLVVEEQVAYLKVDKTVFDDQVFNAAPASQQSLN
jgi:MFS family permease